MLAALTAGMIALVLSLGVGKHAEPAIAGGYDTSSGTSCVGSKFEMVQSGQFVSISNAQGTVSGALRFVDGHLTGSVRCLGHAREPIDARFSHGTLHGAIGSTALSAVLRRDPPAAGTPKPRVPGSIAGVYSLAPSSACLGASFTVTGSGSRFEVATTQGKRSAVSFRDGNLAGTIACSFGGGRTLTGSATGRQLDLVLSPLHGSAAAGDAPQQQREHVQATLKRTSDGTVVAFFVAVLVVMAFARLCGSLMPKIRQPRVMGEVLAGLILGPTVFGAVDPGLQAQLFNTDIVPYIGVSANLGLVFYMFLIGLEVDFEEVRGRVGMTLAISNTGLAVPMILGMASALPLYTLLAPRTHYVAFALFMGVSMSVTAFPVLARIVTERRMIKTPLGVLALSMAAIDDVTAWFLIALATATAVAGSGTGVLKVVGWTAVFIAAMALVVRRVLARAAVAYDEAGRVPATWITTIFAGVLLSAVVTEQIGVAFIFGAFVMGLVMPRHAGLSHEVTKRVEDFVLTLLLPLFFAYTGLRTDVGSLGRPTLIVVTLVLIAIAIVGKFGGTTLAARAMRLPWRESSALGALMNTRGLTELIVLNLALDKGVMSPALFTALVVMALVTTFMTGPLMRLIDPRNEFGSPPEEALAAAPRLALEDVEPPAHAILVAPQSEAALEPLLALAVPLSRWEPRRELVLAQLIRPPGGASVRGGLHTEAHQVREASERLQRERLSLLDQGIATRSVALTATNPGVDLSRLSSSEEFDLVLVDGRRPLLGDGIPREDVGTVLNEAPCDVAVLVAREGALVAPGPNALVMVPFGGAEHDWAALELASWLCAATGASLELLGPHGRTPDGKDAGHMLANAALLVQQFAGVPATPVVAEPGKAGIVSAAASASLLFVGLSDRWRKEGLGETRRAIARAAPAPIVFVRRGERRGALAPAKDVTRFAWSSAGIGISPELSRAASFHRATEERGTKTSD